MDFLRPLSSPVMPRRATALLFALTLFVSACSSAASDNTPSTSEPLDGSTTSTVEQTTGSQTSEPSTSSVTTTEPEPVNLLPGVFTKLTEPGVGGRMTSIAFDPASPDRLLVGGDMLGIAATSDFGQSWSSTTGLASWEIGDITATSAADGRIWAGTLSGPHASDDGGITWTLERTGML